MFNGTSWLPITIPTTQNFISSNTQSAFRPRVSINASGNAMAVWATTTGTIQAAIRATSGASGAGVFKITLDGAHYFLRIEGKPQCHIVALAHQHGQVAASVGCALSRARTGMSVTEATAAIPVVLLDELLESLAGASQANATVARYAGADAVRFR